MILTINGTDYRVKFGVGFIRELDKKYYTANQTGTVKYGLGLETQIPLLLTNDIVTLAEFLYLGTCAEEKRPTQAEVDAYIDGDDDVEALFTEVIEELRTSNATRIKVGELETKLAAEEEKIRAMMQEKKEELQKPTKK